MSYNSPLLEIVIRKAPPGGGPTHHVYLARPTHVPQCIHKQVRLRDKRVGVWGKIVHSTALEALSYGEVWAGRNVPGLSRPCRHRRVWA